MFEHAPDSERSDFLFTKIVHRDAWPEISLRSRKNMENYHTINVMTNKNVKDGFVF